MRRNIGSVRLSGRLELHPRSHLRRFPGATDARRAGALYRPGQRRMVQTAPRASAREGVLGPVRRPPHSERRMMVFHAIPASRSIA
jgi:hypothetical protein